MTLQIQNLIKQVGTDVSGKWIAVDNVNTIAELIVQECLANLYLNGYDDAMNQVKQHFGVEE
jgi:hypothetical protein